MYTSKHSYYSPPVTLPVSSKLDLFKYLVHPSPHKGLWANHTNKHTQLHVNVCASLECQLSLNASGSDIKQFFSTRQIT